MNMKNTPSAGDKNQENQGSNKLIEAMENETRNELHRVVEEEIANDMANAMLFYGIEDKNRKLTQFGQKFIKIAKSNHFVIIPASKNHLLTINKQVRELADKFMEGKPGYSSSFNSEIYVLEISNNDHDSMKALFYYIIDQINHHPETIKPKTDTKKVYGQRDLPGPLEFFNEHREAHIFFGIIDDNGKKTPFGEKYRTIENIRKDSFFIMSKDIIATKNPNVYRLAKTFVDENQKYKTKLSIYETNIDYHFETMRDEQHDGLIKLFRYLVNTISDNPGILKGKKY